MATSSLVASGRAQAHQGGQFGVAEIPDPGLTLADYGLREGALGGWRLSRGRSPCSGYGPVRITDMCLPWQRSLQ